MGFMERLFGRGKESEGREMTSEEMTQMIRAHRKARMQKLIHQSRVMSGQVYANGTPRRGDSDTEIKDIGNFL